MLRNAAKPLQLVARLCAQNGSAMNCAQFRGMALEGAKGFSEKEVRSRCCVEVSRKLDVWYPTSSRLGKSCSQAANLAMMSDGPRLVNKGSRDSTPSAGLLLA